MRIKDIYPMFGYLPILGTFGIEAGSITNVLDYPEDKDVPDSILDTIKVFPWLVYFRNSRIYVPNVQSKLEWLKLLRDMKNPSLICHVDVVDTTWLSFDLLERNRCSIMLGSVKVDFEILYPDIFDLLFYRGTPDSISRLCVNPSKRDSSDGLSEAFRSRPGDKFDDMKVSGRIKMQGIEAILQWLSSPSSDERSSSQVYCLVGHSGVGKSAFLKSIIPSLKTEHGLRIVEVRLSFHEKSDLDGVVRPVVVSDFGPAMVNVPNSQLLTATDEYLKCVRDFLKKYGDELSRSTDPDDKQLYERLKEHSKTPVIVFEETFRIDLPIQRAVMTFFSNKSFHGYSLKEAKMIGAANVPVGTRQHVETWAQTNLYDAKGLGSEAFVARLVIIPVDLTDSESSSTFTRLWWSYAVSPPNVCDIVYSLSYKKVGVVEDYDRDEATGEVLFFVILVGDLSSEVLSRLRDPGVRYNISRMYKVPGLSFERVRVRREDLKLVDPNSGNLSDPGETAIHPLVIEFLSKDPRNLQNLGTLSDKISSSNLGVEGEERLTPITSPRSWENVSLILKKFEKGTPILKNVFSGILDESVCDSFCSFLENKGYIFVESTGDLMSDVLDSCHQVGVPVLLRGPTGFGKSARVYQFVKKLEKRGEKVRLFTLDLSRKDRTDLSGFPEEAPLAAACLGFSPKEDSNSRYYSLFSDFAKGKVFEVGDLVTYLHPNHRFKGNVFKVVGFEENSKVVIKEGTVSKSGEVVFNDADDSNTMIVNVSDVRRDYGLPDKAAVFAPLLKLKSDIDSLTRAGGGTIIIFADEINRVSDPAVSTILFEAVSDRKLMGIPFPPNVKVMVVGCCNVGSANPDTVPLDIALVNRMCVVSKSEYDESDYKVFLNYIESQVDAGRFPRAMLKLLGDGENGLGFQKVKDLFFHSETSGSNDVYEEPIVKVVFQSKSNTRSLETLCQYLMTDEYSQCYGGKMYAQSKSEFMSRIKSCPNAETFLSGWIGTKLRQVVPFDVRSAVPGVEAATVSSSEIFDLVKEYYADPSNEQLLIDVYVNMQAIESHIFSRLSNLFSQALGIKNKDVVWDLVTKFILVSSNVIRFEDLIDTSLVLDYFIQSYGETSRAEDSSVVPNVVTDFKKAFKMFNYSDPSNYEDWIIAMMRFFDIKFNTVLGHMHEARKLMWQDQEILGKCTEVKDPKFFPRARSVAESYGFSSQDTSSKINDLVTLLESFGEVLEIA